MKIFFASLGCDKNLVDAEGMLGYFLKAGYEFTEDEREADVIFVNTCCFINDAKEESIQTILDMAAWKEQGKCKVLAASGCLAQRYRDEIMEQIPELDGIIGINDCEKAVELVESLLQGAEHQNMVSSEEKPVHCTDRILTTGGHYAYLKIAEGCDKHCTYCIIPSVRGKYRSIPEEELIAQAEKLAEQGVKELILVAQETTLYGMDLYHEKRLPQLLKKLAGVSGIYWIRLLYCYPEEITDELLETMASEPKICHYLDIPIQHGSDAVLKRMGRRTDQASLKEKIAAIRKAMPDCALRTTLITGFPGETEEDHEINMDFVNEMAFDRLGVFTYSQEENTPAALMPDQIEEEVKQARYEELMELQQDIAFEKSEAMVGRELIVMVEGKVADENAYVSRTYMDAPGVDGYLFIQTPEVLMTGDFARVRVTGALDYDLIGELIS
ncbi:MAG: 30S ribosomal protein S12 methylthiotransferase RimO [Lachnospiraceae bacterium]|nr:30S ribosomal protein S12 methylthiotransferase RimO [Lachnospiraceae bacterium]